MEFWLVTFVDIYMIYDIWYIYIYDIYIYIYIYIYNLPVNAIVGLPHPRSENSQGQETFLALCW